MNKFTVNISDAEKKALESDIVSIHDWLNNAIHQKARRCGDRIITEHSDKQPGKISNSERATIIGNAVIETAQERNAKNEV